jgi:hypothetical protein
MDVSAIMVPAKVELVPRVAEVPTAQKMFLAWAPFTSTTCALPEVVSVDPIWKMKTAFVSPCASRVMGVSNWAALEMLYSPGVRAKPLISAGRTAAPGSAIAA